MTLMHLDPVLPFEQMEPPLEEHAMRRVTREVAFDGKWSAERAQKVADLFTSMSDEWTESHRGHGRYDGLADALDRGGVGTGHVLELGSGTGLGTAVLAPRFDHVTALDLSPGMLRNAPAELGSRVRGDSATLPIRDSAVDVLVLVNMLLFPAEVERVLSETGRLVWFNTSGERTPIHLTAEEVLSALPGDWSGRASRAGTGTWLVANRT